MLLSPSLVLSLYPTLGPVVALEQLFLWYFHQVSSTEGVTGIEDVVDRPSSFVVEGGELGFAVTVDDAGYGVVGLRIVSEESHGATASPQRVALPPELLIGLRALFVTALAHSLVDIVSASHMKVLVPHKLVGHVAVDFRARAVIEIPTDDHRDVHLLPTVTHQFTKAKERLLELLKLFQLGLDLC